VTDLGGGTGRDVLCLVGRELSLFLAINVSKIPDKQRRGFVELTVRRAAPYDDADFDVSWLGDWAAVWHWSRKRIVEGCGGELPARTRFASEGPYVGQVQESEGTRIEVLRLIAGFEGRIWRSGVLTASRWWPAEPTAEQWQLFLRGTGGAQLESTAPPPPVAAAINTRRWSRTTSRSQALQMSSLQAHVPRATLAVGLAAIALFAWELGAIARAQKSMLLEPTGRPGTWMIRSSAFWRPVQVQMPICRPSARCSPCARPDRSTSFWPRWSA